MLAPDYDPQQGSGIRFCAALPQAFSARLTAMLNEVMEHFGLSRGLRQVGYFETEHHQQLIKGLRGAVGGDTTGKDTALLNESK